jgi:hypothetical protein
MVLYTNSSVRLDAVENMTVIGILVYDWLMLKEYDADCSVRHGRDHMVVGFTNNCAISAYHH